MNTPKLKSNVEKKLNSFHSSHKHIIISEFFELELLQPFFSILKFFHP